MLTTKEYLALSQDDQFLYDQSYGGECYDGYVIAGEVLTHEQMICSEQLQKFKEAGLI